MLQTIIAEYTKHSAAPRSDDAFSCLDAGAFVIFSADDPSDLSACNAAAQVLTQAVAVYGSDDDASFKSCAMTTPTTTPTTTTATTTPTTTTTLTTTTTPTSTPTTSATTTPTTTELSGAFECVKVISRYYVALPTTEHCSTQPAMLQNVLDACSDRSGLAVGVLECDDFAQAQLVVAESASKCPVVATAVNDLVAELEGM